MEHYINLFVQAALIDNMALSFFMGMCTFWRYQRKYPPRLV